MPQVRCLMKSGGAEWTGPGLAQYRVRMQCRRVVGDGCYRASRSPNQASGDSFTAGTCAIACSASAVIVSDGFTPGLAGIAEPSHMMKFR